MTPLLRWTVVCGVAALSFSGTWAVCQGIIGLAADDSSAIGGAFMAIVTLPAAAWASRAGDDRRQAGPRTAVHRAPDGDTRTDYLRAVRGRYDGVDLDVLTPLSDQDDYPQIRLTDVFVPQRVKADPPPVELPREVTLRIRDSDAADAGPLPESLRPDQLDRIREYERREAVDVLSLIAGDGHRLVVLGDPGSGKSTLARFVARRLAEPPVDGPLAPLSGWLPLLIELREYAQQEEHGAGDFLDFFDRQWLQHGAGIPRPSAESHLEDDGRTVVIFDGLDEIFDAARRERVARQIAGFAERYQQARIMVTSRPVGYQRSALESAGFKRYKLQDLDLDRINQFVRRWYASACPGDTTEAARLESRLMAAIHGSAAIRELAGNPMLLTILAIIGRRQALPRDRSSVYQHAVTVLVEHWDPSKFLVGDPAADVPYLDPTDRLEMLRLIARSLQDSAAGLSGNVISGADLTEQFVAFLRQRDPENVSRGQANAAAHAMLRQFRDRNFILSRFGGDAYGFVHRSFLEYLSAADIVHRFTNERSLSETELIDGYFGTRCREVVWHEVLQLTAGMLNERFVNLAVQRMLRADPHWAAGDDVDPQHILVAVRCVGEVRKIGLLADACRAATDHVIRMLTIAHRRVTRSYTDSLNRAIEQSVLPVLATYAAYWPGRDTYLSWFMRNGFIEADDPVTSVTATRIAVTLGRGDVRLRDFLRIQARQGWSANHRIAAAAGLAQGWAGDPRSLEIIRTQCATDPSWEVRHGALQAVVGAAGGDRQTLGLLRDRAVRDENEEIRCTAVRALAAHWLDAPDTRALLVGRVTRDGHPTVRSAALRVLAARWSRESAVRTLVHKRATADRHEQVRRAALLAVATHWSGEPTCPGLLRERAEADGSVDVRRAALTTVAKTWTDDPSTRSWLRARAAADPHPGVRQAAVTALVEGWRDDPETVACLVERLGDESGEVREAVARALALVRVDGTGSVPTLRRLAEHDTSADVRQVAIEALAAQVRHDEAVREWVRERARTDPRERVRATAVRLLAEAWHEDPLIEIWLHETAATDPSPVVRRSAVTGIATAGRDDSDTLPWLRRRAVEDTAGDVRLTAVQHVADGWARSAGIKSWLRERFVDDPDEDVRNVVMRALVAHWHAEPETFTLLRSGARGDPHEYIRRAAVWMIADGWPDEPESLPLLRTCATGDAHEIVRRAAAQAIAVGWHDDAETLPLLVERAAEDPHEHVRAGVLRAIASGWHDDAVTVDLLDRRAVADHHPSVRLLVLQIVAAGWSARPETLRTAIRLANTDPAPAVRLTAVQALARFWPGSRESAAVLHRLATDDPDEEIRQFAAAVAP